MWKAYHESRCADRHQVEPEFLGGVSRRREAVEGRRHVLLERHPYAPRQISAREPSVGALAGRIELVVSLDADAARTIERFGRREHLEERRGGGEVARADQRVHLRAAAPGGKGGIERWYAAGKGARGERGRCSG